MKKKNIKLIIISIISVLLVVTALTYAYWLLTKTQSDKNVVKTQCFDISFAEGNNITLPNQYPVSDEDGKEFDPYTFTITNNCNKEADFQINLELIGDETVAINPNALKINFKNIVKMLDVYSETDTTINDAYKAFALSYGTLASKGSEGSSKTFDLRIWIDEDAPISEMNKIFRSKITVSVGQEIKNPLKEGTLAYAAVSKYGNIYETRAMGYNLILAANEYTANTDKTTSYWFGTEYKLDEKTGDIILSGDLIQATIDECRSQKQCGKYTLKASDFEATSTYLYEVTSFGTSSQDNNSSFSYKNKYYYSDIDYNGVFKTADNFGDSYYFRGYITDNYVEFGEWQEDTTVTYFDVAANTDKTLEIQAGTPMYWRILRINGDGTIRLAYAGINKVENRAAHVASVGATAYNSLPNDRNHVGYTYDDGTGNQVDSHVKTVIDDWYAANMEGKYDKYIADGIFCNDREIYKSENRKAYFAAYKRIEEDKNPSLVCNQIQDSYTTNKTYGNGLLKYPVGLLNADEIELAIDPLHSTDYLTSPSSYYWTMTPINVDLTGSQADSYARVYQLFNMTSTGTGQQNVRYSAPGARPVINLKADVEFTGDGSFETPYKIITE